MTNKVIKFLMFVIGVPSLTMGILDYADASEPFIALGFDVDHHKNETNLCYSGGMSRNLTFESKVMVGFESNDIRTYFFYKNEKCLLNGDLKDPEDHWRAGEVESRDESVGISFEWRTNL